MPTGYEVGMYADIGRIRGTLERIATALEELVVASRPSTELAPGSNPEE